MEVKKYVTYYDTRKQSFVITQRIVTYNQWGKCIIAEGIIRLEQVFDNKEDAIKSLKRSSYIEVD